MRPIRPMLQILIFCILFASHASAQTPRATPAQRTSINGPSTLATDHAGHLFVVEEITNRVLRIDLNTGKVTVIAGNGKECCYADGKLARTVSFSYIWSMTVDRHGNVFIGDGSLVRKVDARTDRISTVAGNGKSGDTVEGAAALAASFWDIDGLAVDGQGNLFLSDGRQEKVFRINRDDGLVVKVSGSGKAGFGGDGGPASDASFFHLGALALDPTGNLYVADEESCRIRRIDRATESINTVVQTGGPEQNCPSQPRVIPWSPAPSDPAVDSAGNLYFIQGSMDVVGRVGSTPQNFTIVAGAGERGFSGDGGPATSATLGNPSGLAIDADGNLFISEYVNNRVRRVDAKTGIITTFAGNGLPHRLDPEM